MKRAFLAGVAAAFMAVPLTAGCEAAPPPASAEWQQPFDRLSHYWAVTRGLGDLGIRLVVLSGNQTSTCDDERLSADYAGTAAYCERQKTVVVAEDQFQTIAGTVVRRGGTVRAARAIILAHEIGHRVEDKVRGGLVPSKQNELVADCLASEALGDTGGDVSDADAEAFYMAVSFAPDQDKKAVVPHGTAAERLQYFHLPSKDAAGNNYGCGVRGHTLYQDGHVDPGI